MRELPVTGNSLVNAMQISYLIRLGLILPSLL